MDESADSSKCRRPPKRKQSRKVYRLTILALLVLLGLTVIGFNLFVSSRFKQDPLEIAYEKIEEGMPIEDAFAIIGRPREASGIAMHVDDPRQYDLYEWFGDECYLEIWSYDERVAKKSFVSLRETLWERIRRLLNL